MEFYGLICLALVTLARSNPLSSESCESGHLPCANGDCLNEDLFCNGDSDCSDGSDEDACNATCNCDWRYLQHYVAKGCVAETVDTCGCPQKFSCPSNYTQQATSEVCIHKQKEYKIGSRVVTSNPCLVCKCRNGHPPEISCVSKDCPQLPAPEGEDCHLVYEANRCCPLRFQCLKKEPEESPRNKTCEYNGQLYPFGSRIYPEDDPCQTCICDENWDGHPNASCFELDCLIERSKSKLDDGCIPVYHESRCCPTEFYCPPGRNLSYVEGPESPSFEANVTSYDSLCYFAGQFYEVGNELDIGNPCVECTCGVPPDFTCIHQACPPSPSEESCYRIFSPGKCCPLFECMTQDAPEDGCPTPLCSDSSCRIETPEGHECPTCVCSANAHELEHNNLEQVQQISQTAEQMEPFQQQSVVDHSEEVLQLMPLRVQEHLVENMVLVDQYAEDLRELEDNSSTEAVNRPVLDDESSREMNGPSSEGQTYKNVHKRSLSVEQKELNEDIEREGEVLEGKREESFEDELQNFKKNIFDKNQTIINEILSINHEVKVPPGCPTPLCESSWCRITIPEGHRCPTCVCKSPVNNEP